MWWSALVAVLAALVLLWLVLLLALWRLRPDDLTAREALRLLPDVLRLVSRLARDRTLPFGLRLRLWLLLGYLALPFDLVPDVIPVIGYADDVVLVMIVLRSVVRRAGATVLSDSWPGTAQGLAVVTRLAGLKA
ncbi:MAG: YkvA family protein [Mycobacteriales bacterium]